MRYGLAQLFGDGLLLIAGPCVIESEGHARMMASELKAIATSAGVRLVFKASYDKANRTSIKSFRGPGLEAGLAILDRIRTELDVPVLSDVHGVGEVAAAAEVLDVLQIPAFLSRQTDLIVAAANSGKVVNIKKAQFAAAGDMRHALEKAYSTGNREVFLTERGSAFGYGDLVADMRSLAIMRGLGAPVVFDGTHSVQRPGGLGDASGGDRRFVPHLCRAAAAAGVDGVFLEVHDNPDAAKSDGPNMLPLADLPKLLADLVAIDRLVRAAPGAEGR